MIVAPCKDYKDRELGCHAKCEEYIAFRKQRDEENEREREYKQKMFVPAISNIKRRVK